MRSITRCDFCEAEAAGTFEIVPPALEPAEDEQRRVMLCEGCRGRLEGLLEPLFARLDVGAETADSDEASGSNESGEDDEPGGTDGAEETASDAFEAPATVETDDADGEGTVDEDTADATTDVENGVRSDDVAETSRPPRAYGKVVRLLRNREFPMERDAVESLAAGAYDLQPDDVDAIVDYAVDQGEFEEADGELVRA